MSTALKLLCMKLPLFSKLMRNVILKPVSRGSIASPREQKTYIKYRPLQHENNLTRAFIYDKVPSALAETTVQIKNRCRESPSSLGSHDLNSQRSTTYYEFLKSHLSDS